MNTQEKSLELARLMGWELSNRLLKDRAAIMNWHIARYGGHILQPYKHNDDGLAQFAAILLKFPEVMNKCDCDGYWEFNPSTGGMEPTQANILDEILRMNGVEI